MPPTRKVILYIAASLDGYIAREDGDISFLSLAENGNEDYGYAEFLNSVDTVIMGRKTYEKILSFGIPFPHENEKTYILTRTPRAGSRNLEFFSGDPSQLIRQLKESPGKDIFIDGGSETIHALLLENLIDEMILSVIPVLLGGGIPLFMPGRPEQQLELLRSESFESGLVQLHYRNRRSA